MKILNLKRHLTKRQVSLYLDADELERIGQYATLYSASQSEMLRAVIGHGLDALDLALEEADHQDCETALDEPEPLAETPTAPQSADPYAGLTQSDARQLGAVQAGIPLSAVAESGWDAEKYETPLDQIFAEAGIDPDRS